MNRLTTTLLACTALAASSSAMAVVLDIDFNGNEFLLGTFDSTQSGAEFYSYGNPSAASANPRYPDSGELIPLEADALQIFAHVETDTDILSFGIILEKPNGSGGGTFTGSATFSSGASVTLVDDTGDVAPNVGDVGDGVDPMAISLNWSNCCTDGFVIGGFDPEDLFIDLFDLGGSDLTKVIFLSPDGPNANTEFPFPGPDEPFEISIVPCDPATDPNQCEIPTPGIPEPTTLALAGIGLAGLRFARRRTKKH